jgi:dephospho-CoA kinase
MIKIGITGGIGSGKTIVCKILEAMNFPVYYSDIEAKQLTNTDPVIREKLLELVGEEVYLNGELNRPFLASQLFSDESMRSKVNAIIHPRVRLKFSEWAAKQNSQLIFNEAAILFETGAFRSMDKNVLVTSPIELRTKRIAERDQLSEKSVLERISAQWSDDQKIPLADFILVNDDQHPLLDQVEALIAKLNP